MFLFKSLFSLLQKVIADAKYEPFYIENENLCFLFSLGNKPRPLKVESFPFSALWVHTCMILSYQYDIEIRRSEDCSKIYKILQ